MRLIAVGAAASISITMLQAGPAGASAVSAHHHKPAPSAAVGANRGTTRIRSAALSGNAIVPGFNAYTLPANDDGSTSAVSLPFPIEFYGTTYTSLYINNNGNLTMGQPLGQYTPQSLNQLGIPMIAPFWADVDTRTGPVVTYGYGTVGGHAAFGVNWLGVGCYAENNSVTNYFQVLLISRSDIGYGNFDIEFNYGPITWDSGQASGGNGQCLGGTAARAGYTSGFGASYEMSGSGVDGGLLSSNALTGLSSHSMSSSQPGRYVFAVRGAGHPQGPSYVALGDSYSSGLGTLAYNLAGDPCYRGALAWPFLMSVNYPAAPHISASSFYACAGDTIPQLLNGGPGQPVSQLQLLKNWVSNNGSPGLVTVTIGGNDLHFRSILFDCVLIGAPACVHDADNQISYLKSGAFTAILSDAYRKIKSAAGGSANVVVVGYPFLFPTPSFSHDLSADYHCPWLNGDAAQVLSRFQQGQLEADSVMAQAASQAGVQFIPLDDAFAGHELCTGQPFINNLDLSSGAGHPNLTGQKLMSQTVATKLGLLAGNGGLARPARPGRVGKGASRQAKVPARAQPIQPKATATMAGARAIQSPPAQHAFAKTTQKGAAPALAINSALPSGQVSAPYAGFLWANGGTAPYSWSVTAGSLPAGLSLDPSTGIISGTPTASGTSAFTVTATDSSSPAQTTTANLSITVDPIPPLAVQTSQLASPTVGQQYSATLAAAGGIPPYTWAVTSGSLPAGLSLDTSSGAITGTPTTAGSRTFTVTATDSSTGGGTTASATFTANVVPATSPLTLTPPQLPGGTQGTGYTGQLTSTGGAAPLYWSVTSGSLPDGLSLDPGTGQVTGIPTAAGTFSFTTQVADGTSPVPQSATENLSITIAAAPAANIEAPPLPDAVAGSAYGQTIDASGGVAPYTWSVSSGSLPDGLSLDPESGTISGTPTSPGTYSFDVSLADSSTPSPMFATVSMSLTVAPPPPPPAMTVTDTVTDGTVGAAYSASFVPANGTGPYTFAVSAGALPDGLSLDPQNGTITGTPTTPGTFTPSIQVTDSSSPSPQVATDSLSITIQPPAPLAITTSALPDASASTNYAQPITATGGTAADTFAITAGTLPNGLNLDPGTGIISGTPTGIGSSSFTVTVTDSATPSPNSASVDLTLTTDATPSLAIPASTLPDAVQGFAYSQGLAATGGAPPYTWSVSSGSLPDGLSLDPSSGIISGVPTGAGSPTFAIEATDSSSPTPQTATETLTLNVDPASPLSIVTSALDPATQGTFYSAALDPDGGTGPVTWSLASGSLPAGLTLDPGTGAISGTPTGSGTSYFTIQATDSSTPAQTATVDLSLEVIPLIPQSISFTPPASGAVGEAVTLSATGGGSGNPVVFSVDPSSGTGVCRVSGTNGATLHFNAVGSCVIDANQAGNTTYAPAPQAQATINVIKATTTNTLTLSSSSVPYGQETTLVFTITVKPQYTGTPTGTVTVSAGKTKLCKATLSKGKATCSPTSSTILPAGVYSVRAAYSGSSKFGPSKSIAQTLTITS